MQAPAVLEQVRSTMPLCSMSNKNIADLLENAAGALASLGKSRGSVADRKAAFQSHMDTLLVTLHTVDVLMKRSLWRLDEAGIVSLSSNESQDAPVEAAPPTPPP